MKIDITLLRNYLKNLSIVILLKYEFWNLHIIVKPRTCKDSLDKLCVPKQSTPNIFQYSAYISPHWLWHALLLPSATDILDTLLIHSQLNTPNYPHPS